MKKTKANGIFVFILSIFLLCCENAFAVASMDQGGKARSAAPEFTLKTAGDKTVSLKDLKGKGVMLFFFTTWCPYCRQKFPSLVAEYEDLRIQGIELVVVNAGESGAKISSFISKEKLPFDILLDSSMKTSEEYGVLGVPTFVLVSKSGEIIYQGNDLPRNYKELLSQ